jgi:hypothetical protein
MGIQHSSSLPPPPGVSPSIELQVTTGGAVDPESVNRAVENRAMEPGNVAKLRAAPHATARHIFVPIYFGAPMTFSAVRHVVVGGANGVLFVEPPDDWRRMAYDPLATSDPDRWRAP